MTTAKKIALPPISEQRSIVDYLDREMGKFDAMTVKLGEAINRLKELRNALISAAVTGKFNVREAVP
jgi:type I restriction enzyme S subunit